MEDKKKALYDALSGEFDLGSFESFSSNIEDDTNRRNLYDAIKDSYNVGDYDSFSAKLTSRPANPVYTVIEQASGIPYPGKETDKSQYTFTGEQLNLEEESPKGYTQIGRDYKIDPIVAPQFKGEGILGQSTEEYMTDVQKNLDARKKDYNQLRQEQGIRAGRQDVVKDGDRYYTPGGSYDNYLAAGHEVDMAKEYNGVPMREIAEYYSLDENKRASYAKSVGRTPEEIEKAYESKEKGDINNQMSDLYRRIDAGIRGVNQKKSALQSQYEKERGFGGFIKDALMSGAEAELPVLQGQLPGSALEGSREWQNLDKQEKVLWASARQFNTAQKIINAAKSGDFITGMGDALQDLVLGGSAQDMQDLAAINEVSRKFEKGEKLTAKEEMLLESIAMNVAVASQYQEELPAWYNAGKMTGEMIPYMVEMWMNPLSKLGKKFGQKVLDRAKEKYGKDLAKHLVSTKIKTGAAKLGGAALGGYGMSLTTGLPSVITGVQKRTQGDAVIDKEMSGDIKYAGRKDTEGLGAAIYKETTQKMLDNASEMLGAGYLRKPFSWLQKAGKDTRLLGWIDNVANSKFGKTLNDFFEKTNWHGPLEEFMEEIHVGILEPMLVGDTSWGEFFTGKNLATIAIGVSVPGVAMATAATIQGAKDGAFKAGAKEKWKMEQGELRGIEAWGPKWEEVKQKLDSNSLDDVDKVLTEIHNDKTLTPEQKVSAFEYGIYGLQYRTARGVADAFDSRKDMLSEMLRDAYAQAYSNEPTGEWTILASDNYQEAAKRVMNIFQLSEEQEIDEMLAKNSVETLANGDSQVADMLYDYKMRKAYFEGAQDRFLDTLEEQFAQSDKSIDSRANKDNPTAVYSTVYNGEQVDITGGNVVLFENGKVDYDNSSETLYVTFPDNTVKPVSAKNFTEVVTVENAEELKAAGRAEIDNRWRSEFDNAEKIILDGKKRKEGKLFNTSDELGEHTVEILNEGEKMSDILLDGAQMEIPTKELNSWKQEAGIQTESENAEKVVEPAAPKTALEQIPRNEKNVPLYEQVDSELAWDGVVEEAGGNEETAMVAVNSMIEDKKRALAAAEKAKAKAGATITEKIAAENKRVANIEKAKADLVKWQEIAGVKVKRAAAQAEAVQAESGVAPIEAESKPVVETLSTEEIRNEESPGITFEEYDDAEYFIHAVESKNPTRLQEYLDYFPEGAYRDGARAVMWMNENGKSQEDMRAYIVAVGEARKVIRDYNRQQTNKPAVELTEDVKTEDVNQSENNLEMVAEGGNAPGQSGVVDNNSANALQNGNNELNLQKENESDNESNQNDIPVGGQVPQSVPQGEHGTQASQVSGAQETAARLRERIESAQGDSKSGLREVENRVTREFAQENGLWIEDEFKLGVPFPSGDEHNNYIDAENQVVYKVNNRMHTPSVLDLLDRIEQHNKYFPDSKYSLVGFTSVSKNGDVMPVFAQGFVPDARMATVDEIDSYMGTLGFTRVGDGRYSNGEVVIKDLKPRNVLADADGDIYVVDAEFEQETKNGGEITDTPANSTDSEPDSATPTNEDELDIYLAEIKAVQERQKAFAQKSPRPSSFVEAYTANDDEAIKKLDKQFNDALQTLVPLDIPAIEATIKGMKDRKSSIKAGSANERKETPAYKAFDHIEKALAKRKKQLEKEFTEDDKRRIDIIKRGNRGELKETARPKQENKPVESEPIKDEAPVTSETTEQPETGEVANAGPVNRETLQLNMSEEDFNALLNSGDKAAISEYLAELDGALRIDENSPFAGQVALREEYRKAVEQYGKENIPAEVMDDLNSRMQPYSDLSRAIFDRKYALQDKLREIEANEAQAKEQSEKVAKAEHKQTAFGGFLAGKSDLGASAAEKALSKKYNFDGKVMTVAEFVEDAVGNGDVKLSAIEEPKYKGASRAAWNRMDARQQEADAKRVKESGTKTVYTVNDHDLGKTAYDYAKFLLDKKAEQEKSSQGERSKGKTESESKQETEEGDVVLYRSAEDNEARAITYDEAVQIVNDFNKTFKGAAKRVVVSKGKDALEQQMRDAGFDEGDIALVMAATEQELPPMAGHLWGSDGIVVFRYDSAEKLYEALWHENTHRALRKLYGNNRTLAQTRFDELPEHIKQEYVDFLKAAGYKVNEYAEETLCYFVGSRPRLIGYLKDGRNDLTSFYRFVDKNYKRFIDFAQNLIDYTVYHEEEIEHRERSAGFGEIAETTTEGGNGVHQRNSEDGGNVQGTETAGTTGGLTESEIALLEASTGYTREEIIDMFGYDLNRSGAGPLTDREVVMESDPYSKVLGKPRYYGKRQREFVARQRRRMAEKARQVAEKLNLDNVEVLESTEGLTGKKATSKGWFDPRTGKITVVVPNHGSIDDIVETVLHEEGFDKVAWTTGEQQAERYNIGAVLKGLKAYKTSANEYYVIPYNNGAIGEFVKEYTEQELADTFGKELAQKIITNAENATEENPYEIEGEELRVGGEGMKGFYDRMLPSFVQKYTKKWGAKVGEVTMPNLRENNTMHSVDVTPEMQESVMEGQTMFRRGDIPEVEQQRAKQQMLELIQPFAKEKREEENLKDAERVINEFNRTHKGALPVRIVQNFDNWKDEFRGFGVKEDEISRFEERIKEGSGRPKGAYLPDADIIVIFDHSLKGRDLEGALWHENMHKAIREDNREGIPTLESALRKIFRDDFDAAIKEAEEYGYIGEDAYEEIACQLVQVAYLEDKMNANGIKGRGVFQDFVNPLIKKVYGREGGDIYERVLGKSEGIYEEELSGRSLASPVERKEGAGGRFERDSNGRVSQGAERENYKESERRALPENSIGGGVQTTAGEEETRFRISEEVEADGSIDDVKTAPLTLMERITNSLLEVSAKNKENLELRADALRAYGRDMENLLKLMRAQREYDKSTVDQLVKLAKMYFKNAQLVGEVSTYEMGRILSVINNVVGRKDISANAEKLMDILMDAHNKALGKVLAKAEKVKPKKINASGVEVIGSLDMYGQEMVESYNAGKLISGKQLDDAISDAYNNLADKDREVRKVFNLDEDVEVEKFADEYIPTGEDPKDATIEDYKKSRASVQGYELAREYVDNIQSAVKEIADLEKELKDALMAKRKGEMSQEAYNEFRKSTMEAIFESKVGMIDAYHSLISKFSEGVRESGKRAKAFQQAQIDRVKAIQHNANSDMEGHPAKVQGKKPTRHNNAITRALMSPLGTFQTILEKFGEKAVDGKGYLYDRFMTQATDAGHKEFEGIVAARATIEIKLKELFGKRFDTNKFCSRLREHCATVSYIEAGKEHSFELTRGQALYIYMANKMTDGQMKLRKMGITEEVVASLVKELPEKMVLFADWVQDDLMVTLRGKYNAVHERLFGVSMAAIENYFPLKIRKEGIGEKKELGQDAEAKPSTITGAIIKRTKNSAALDLSADAMQVLLEHIDQMEHWAAFAEFNRDINSLINYRHFQNQVKSMTTLRYGSGDVLWKNFQNVVAIATETYKPERSEFDKAVLNITKGITRSKINFRLYTALKQLLSAPAFWNNAGVKELAFAYANPAGSIKWAMENLPGFKERWMSRSMGNEKLLNEESDWKVFRTKFVENATKWGMTPNAAVDALTVAQGARAVYLTKLRQFKDAGYSEEQAGKKALQRAAESYNESQQSSEGAYLSAMQASGTAAAAIFTTFKNSNFGYTRKTAQAVANISRKMHAGYKKETIEFMKKKMMREGLTEEQAEKFATKIYYKSLYKDVADVALFGAGLGFLWNFGGMAIYLIAGDDDDEKEKTWEEIAIRSSLDSLNGIPFGETAINAVMAAREGNMGNIRLPEFIAFGDVKNLAKVWDTDRVKFANDLINMLLAAGVGVEAKPLTDLLVALGDMEDWSAEEFGLFALRTMSAPSSQLDRLLVDDAMENNAASLEEVAMRYIQYKKGKDTPITGWMYSDEGEQEAVERYGKRFAKYLDERLENVVEDNDTFDVFYNSSEPGVKKSLSSLRQKFLAGENADRYQKFSSRNLILDALEVLKGNLETSVEDATYFEMTNSEDVDATYLMKSEMLRHEDVYKAWNKLKGTEKREYGRLHEKELEYYKDIKKKTDGISRYKSKMKESPENAERYMTKIREKQTQAIELINNYRNE